MKDLSNKLISWLQNEVSKANAKGVIFGISGGIDSAVVAHLVKSAFPNNHLAVWMGINSSLSASRNASRVISDLDLTHRRVDLSHSYEMLIKDITSKVKDLNDPEVYEKYLSNPKHPELILNNDLINMPNYNLALNNAKSRLRMTTLYTLAQMHNYLVIGTSNAAEIYLGYFTKWGDGAADLYPLASLNKRQVYSLAKELGVNEYVINAKPSADLYEGQTDEEDMGVKYNDVDDFLEGKEIDSKSLERIQYLHKITQHKRNTKLNQPDLTKK